MLLRALLAENVSVDFVVMAFLSSFMVVFLCMPFTDFICAHIAVKLGDYTPRYNGRLTLNPLAHIDPIGATMMMLFGFGFGKGALYNPYNFKNPRKGILIISLAGPLSLLVLGLLFCILFKVVCLFVTFETTFLLFLAEVLRMIVYLSVSLAVFRLIPIPPMDGGVILFHFLPDRFSYAIRPYERYLPFVLLAVIYSGALDYPLYYARMFFLNLFDLITFWI